MSPGGARLAAWLVCILGMAVITSARADGEVGLVIVEDGQVRSFCVAYTGSSISGDDLLTAAGLSYGDLGTSSGSVLCSIEDTGCFDAGSYDQCWCKCSGSGGSNCVYWAFFTREHGEAWVYSSRAFDRTSSNDGDLHAWKWGQGGASSAPRPSDSLTFESVCGHAPRGGVAPTTQPPTVAPTASSPSPASGSPPPGVTEPAPATSATGTSTLIPEVSVTFAPTVPGPTPGVPRTASRPPGDDGGGPWALAAFGGVVVLMALAIAGAAFWRRSRGD